ncbi:MAG: nucleotidyltransferase family protein [Vicinamibacteria bacterium]|nr:nucleotidyltransferase family protein [Vicinamibacteria bacterium]
MTTTGERAGREALRRWLVDGRLPAALDAATAEALVAAAAREGLSALLDDAVEREHPAWATAAVAGELRASHRACLAASLRRLDLAADVLHRLEAAGVPALPLKGAAVAETLYDSPAHRAMADVDVLVLGDWAAATSAMTAAGFTRGDEADHAVALVAPDGASVLELHHALSSCPGLFELDREGMWRRRRPGTGLVPWLPDPVDGLLALAQHAAFQHGLVLRLGQYLDLRRAVEREAIPLTTLLERARPAALLACAGLALGVAHARVGGDALAAWAAQLEPHLTRAQRRLRAAASRSGPGLAAVRWQVAAGRRARLLRLTLAPRGLRAAPRRAMALAVRMFRGGGRASKW